MHSINVLIVTYKQANVIGRNIESILQQKEYGLNKIVICDDHSPDNNWEVIQQYVKKYPDYIEAYRNESNLGIYGNSNKLITLRGKADFYCWLEGDDALCDGFFKASQEFLANTPLDTDKPIALMSNFIVRYQDREDIVDTRNCIVNKNKKYFGLYIRGLVSWRASLFSSGVMNLFTPAIIDQGLSLAESSFDCQFFRYLEKAYYLPVLGSIYYAGIGVSVGLNDSSCDYKTKEGIVQWSYYLEHLVNNKQDMLWCKANRKKCEFLLSPSYNLAFSSIFLYYFGLLFTYRLSISHAKSFFAPILKIIFSKSNGK